MLLTLIIIVMAGSVLLSIAGMFVPEEWEQPVMGASILAGTVALSFLVAAAALGYRLAA